MSTYRIVHTTTVPKDWDKFVAKYDGFFINTSEWVRLYQYLGIGDGIYIEVYKENKKVLQLVVWDVFIGGTFLSFLPKAIISFISRFYFLRAYTFHMSPVILDKKIKNNHKELEKLSYKVLSYIIDLAEKNNRSILPASYLCFSSKNSALTLKNRLSQSTQLLGSTRLSIFSEEDYWKKLDSSVRNKIGKAQKNNVQVEFITPELLDVFIASFKESWNKNRVNGGSKKYYKLLWSMFPKNVKYIAAWHNGHIVAGAGLMQFGHTIIEFAIFSTQYGKKLNIGGGELLQWQIIKYSLQEKITILDLNMIAVSEDSSLEEKLQNINNFKLKWKGEIIYGISLLHITPFLRKVQKIKQRFLGK